MPIRWTFVVILGCRLWVVPMFGSAWLLRIEDRGVVAILDSRIVTKRYGSVILNSMPPLWRTSDGAVVRDSLRRLAKEVE